MSGRPGELSPVKRALLALEELQGELSALKARAREPVAVVGLACRLPGQVTSPEAFWRLLREGRDGIGEVPAERWDARAFYDPDPAVPGKIASRWGGFLDEPAGFDADFFGISPREARQMDPQQRWLLEVGYEAFEDAGLSLERLAGSRTGVFVGCCSADYGQLFAGRSSELNAYTMTGLSDSIISNRVSYQFDLRGPSITMDTACSSSLVAVHLACQSLRSGECDLALVGGVNSIFTPLVMISASRAFVLAADGRCKTFDARADGIVRGEGCAALVLKRLSAARADGDRVWAVIRGSAVNQDGRTNGLTAPNVLSQQAVLRAALENAGVSAESVRCVEAHGTGTPLGDPIEVEALNAVYGRGAGLTRELVLGSAKTNLGHLEGAAGVTGLLKVVLALERAEIPAHLHFRRPNPRLELERTPFAIPGRTRPWPAGEGPRRGAVSSFGMGGTNAHVILEEAPPSETRAATVASAEGGEAPVELLALSARTEEALSALALAWAERLRRLDPAVESLADLCYGAARRRSHLRHRLAVAGRSPARLAELLARYGAGEGRAGLYVGQRGETPGKLAFVFSGQGAQFAGMGRELLATEPVFAEAISRADAHVQGLAGWSLREALLAPEEGSRLSETAVAQPCLVALELGLVELLRSQGIRPDFVLGHSVGELAAAAASGALTVEEALTLAVVRGRLMQEATGKGRMLAVALGRAELEPRLGRHAERLALAADNGPRSLVVAGEAGALAELAAELTAEGVQTKDLGVDYAFHSPQVDAARLKIERELANSRGRPTERPLVSTVTGGRLSGEALDGAYWGQNVRGTVRFREAVEQLVAEGVETFLEVGPQAVLGRPLTECLEAASGASARRALVVPTLRRSGAEVTGTLRPALGALYCAGQPVDFGAVYPTGRVRPLPSYPWQHRPYWVEGPPAWSAAGARPPAAHPLLVERESHGSPAHHVFRGRVGRDAPAFVGEHALGGRTIFPAAGFFELALSAGERVLGPGALSLVDVSLRAPLVFEKDDEGERWLELTLRPETDAAFYFTVTSRDAPEAAERLHVEGRLERAPTEAGEPEELSGLVERCPRELSREVYREGLARLGLALGPSYSGHTRLALGRREVLGAALLPPEYAEEAGAYRMHPGLLDAMLQLVALAQASATGELGSGELGLEAPYLPIGIERLTFYERPTGPVVGHARVERPAGDGTAAPEAVTGTLEVRGEGGERILSLVGAALRKTPLARLGQEAAAPRELTYRVAWRPLPTVEPQGSFPAGRWLLLGQHPLGAELAAALEAEGQEALRFSTLGEALPALATQTGEAPLTAVLLGGLALPMASAAPLGARRAALRELLDESLGLVRALAEREPPARLVWLTRGVWQVDGVAPTGAVEGAALWGLGRSAALELPDRIGALVDLAPEAAPDEATALAGALLGRQSERELALRGGRSYAPRLARHRRGGGGALALAADGVYLVTGGLGGLGLACARYLVEQGARRLLLVGRSAPGEEAARKLAELRSLGAEVELLHGDVSERAFAIEVVAAAGTALRGILHAAGVLDDGLLVNQTGARFLSVLAPKLDGAEHLLEATTGHALDFFALFSSGVGLTGSPGQGSYAAANACLDALALRERAAGRRILSLDWGAWAEVGMAARLEAVHRRFWESHGLSALSTAEALGALGELLAAFAAPAASEAPEAQLLVCPVNWEVARSRLSPGAAPLFAELLGGAPSAGPGGAGGSPLAARVAGLSGARRVAQVAEALRQEIVRVLGLDAAQPIEMERPLAELGFDSLLAIELRNAVAALVGRSLPVTLLFDHPTLGRMAAHLAQTLGEQPAASVREESTPSAPSAAPPFSGVAATSAVRATPSRRASRARRHEPIAIVGLGCRFPGGANDPEAFFELLRRGTDAVVEVPRERWDVEAYYDPSPGVPGKSYARWGGFLEGVDVAGFDAPFFGIAPGEAAWLDPQQRLLLEVAWEALEDAAIPVRALADSATGVYLGIASYDYSLLSGVLSDPRLANPIGASGSSFSAAAGRLSFSLGLRGPNFPVDTACSSGLVATHLACQALRTGECQLALVAGVNLMLAPHAHILFSQVEVLAKDGRCKTFDARADGYTRGEGCAVLVLKRLADAEADGDRVLALLAGSAVNHDGRSSSFTAPSSAAQREVVRRALAQAELSPSALGYVETHGSGTALGDPIELGALGAVLVEEGAGRAPLAVGTVKTNVGHLEAAAGLAGIFKAIYCLEREELPRHLHLERLTPHVDWTALPLVVPTAPTPFPRGERPRAVGVSAFGLSGTNAHVVLEEAPALRTSEAAPRAKANVGSESGPAPELLVLSAKSPGALLALCRKVEAQLSALPEAQLSELCRTAALRREHQPWRLAAVGRSPAELARAVAEERERFDAARAPSQPLAPGLVFVCSGQGGQWPGMGAHGLRERPAFRAALERCDRALLPLLGWSVVERLAAGPSAAPLEGVAVVQPMVFAMQLGLAAELAELGVLPDAVAGHSMGEVAAACLAGALSLEDAARVIVRRSALLGRVQGEGGMVVVEASRAELGELLAAPEEELCVAAENGPRNLVLALRAERVAELLAELERRGLFAWSVKVNVASHSPQVEPLRSELLALLGEVQPRASAVPFYSTVRAGPLSGTALEAEYWFENLRRPVRFAETVRRAVEDGHGYFVELGPHPVLLKPLAETLGAERRRAVAFGSGQRERPEADALLETLGRLHAAHAPVELARSFAPPVRPIPLPSYPWQREAHWLAPPEVHAAGSSAPSAERAHPLLRERAGTGESAGGRSYEVRLGGALRDHRVKGVAVAPAAAYLAAALGAAARGRPRAVLQIEELQLEQLATLPEQGALALDLQLESTEAATTFELRRTSGARLARGRLVDGASATPAVPRETLAELRARCPATLSAEGFYSASAGAGWEFGPAFRTVCGMSQGEGEALVRLELPDALAREASAYEIHPVLLDGCFQALGGATGIREGEQLSSTVLPVGLRRLRLLRRGAATGWAHARLRPGAGGLEGEVTLYNDEGLPILEAEGLVVRTLEGLALSAEGLTHAVSWDERAVAELPASGPSSRRWLLVGEGQGLTERLAERLRGRGEPVVTALGTEAPGEAAPHRRKLDLADPAALEALVTSLAGDDWVAPTELVYLGALELGAASEERAFAEAEARGGAWLELVRAVVKGRLKTIPRVTILSAGAHAVGDDAPPLAPGLLAQAVFAGLGATLALEHPELRPRQIDLSSGTPDEEELALLLRLLAEGGALDRLALRAGRCLAARLVPLPLASPSPSTPPAPLCRPEASYLVTGGLGGLGLAVASWLVEQGARRVCLLGRHGVSEPRQAEAIAALEGRGARVLVLEGDVADAPALVRVVETMEAELGPLGGVIHAAGLLENALLLDLDRQRLGRVWAPKVQGAWNLHLATRERPLDFFVLFSSMAALLGAPGQGNYAAANAFLEALGPARRRAGLPATVIAWSAWAEIGAAARALASGRFALLDGSRALLPAEALATLGQILSARAPQVAVFSLDLPRLVQATRGEAPAVPALLRALLPEARPGGAATPRLRDELLSLEVAARDARLEEYLTSQVARTLGLPAARIDLERPLQELGLDSRLAILLKNQVNRDLGEVLPIVRLVEGPSLAGLRRIVLDELGRGARAEPRPLDLEAEGRLPDDLVPAGTLPARFAAPRTLLLTGATGFLGSFLVAELLAGADLQLVCLVRAASDAEALGRVKAQLEAQGLWRAGFEGRLSAVAGDLAAPRFGLAPARYEALAGRVDEVLHNGARIDLVLPYEALRDANVGGTLEALRLALHGRVRPLHYVSTLAIFQADAYEAEPRIFEDAPLLPATGLVSGYMQTKWVSERLLEAARARGLPVTVLRPGLISGDSILGRTDRDGWFRLLLAELLGRQVAPAVELPLNLTPVDYVARAIARLVLRRESLGHAFHLFNPTSGRLEQVLAFVAQKGHAIQRLPLPAWRELVGGGAGQPAASLFAQLLPALLRPELVIDPEAYDLAKKIDGANAARGLEGSGIACPRLDETLLETYFAYLGRQGWLGS